MAPVSLTSARLLPTVRAATSKGQSSRWESEDALWLSRSSPVVRSRHRTPSDDL